jgi:adenine-specific DNA-methyltransferase
MPPKKKHDKKAAAPVGSVSVDAIKHQATRTNIPTRELQAMAAEHEEKPTTLRYPRDTSLDPQLVWKGKDTQDGTDLEVVAPPIYIQEKVHPQAIIEDIRERARAGRPKVADLFSDFNGIDDAKKTEFYKHDQHWSNRMILGDSLTVMASLAEKEHLRGRVQMIYMDPPYGIRFGSNWQVKTNNRDVKDGKKDQISAEREVIKAFRDTWELGIHSYLKVWRDRLIAARDLLTESGSIFVQIGDENVHLVRCLLDEVFGSENNICQITFGKTSGATAEFLPAVCDYVLWYAKNKEVTKYRELFEAKGFEGKLPSAYNRVELKDGTRRTARAEELGGQLADGYRLYALDNFTSPRVREARTGYYPIEMNGKAYLPKTGEWKTNREGVARLRLAHRLEATIDRIGYVRYLDDFPALKLGNVWLDTVSSFMADKVYVVQTNTKVIERCLLMTTDPGDLVLDPTCGSGTTAYVAEQWGRRWITIDTSRVSLTLARTRLAAARFPYYLLADSPEGRKKEYEVTGKASPGSVLGHGYDIRQGFVYKRVPHVTLKSIANNPDIKEGMTRTEIDAAIRRHADTETLYDQPYEDKNVVRVTGPFTVESLSPHRMLPTGTPPSWGEVKAAEREVSPDLGDATGFVRTILDNIKTAGVQNTRKKERLKFTDIEPFASQYIQARATYEEDGNRKWAAICIGPEFGTVGPELLRQAAKDANKGIGFDLLLIFGFAFDPLVYEDGKDAETKLGRCKVWFVRMNQDLTMGDELKKTANANLFMVFGEPDIVIRPQPDGKLVVEIRGLDVFDPTTGEIRSGGTDDLAAWFIDTAYDGDSFFVRHAYFCGGDEPYDKLKRALRAEIDEGEWAKLYTTTSQPFDPPKSGKIAVKVINHYGDEVLKVYPVAAKATSQNGKMK